MYLKSLELSGFKSFAKKADLKFNSPITAIVGPNGSGKSNVAESFRFVLGEQSIKSLRGKRGEDLIWNGGGESGRANRASAKLVFDNSRRVFPGIDFDEVSIERIVHRDNTNEYLLNGSQVRLKDIVEILAGAHIGATGHHIISQGEADRILSASVRERREMIEDALGLKIYQWKKLESLRKLEKTEENVKQVESLRREIAPHLRFLKKQVEKVEKAEQLRVELRGLYKEYFAREDAYINAGKARISAELGSPSKELADLDQALNKAREILASSKAKDVKSEAIIHVEKEIASTRARKDEISREIGRIEGEIMANKRAIEKEKEKQKRDELKTVYLRDVEEVIEHIGKLESIVDAKKLFQDVMGALRDFVRRHRSLNDSAVIGEAESEISRLHNDKVLREADRNVIIEKEKELAHRYEAIRQEIEKEKDTNRDAEKEVFRIIARQNELRGTISRLNAEMNVFIRDEDAFKRELGEAGIIIGREAVEYSEISSSLVMVDVLKEDRKIQEERRKQVDKIKVRLEDAGAGGGAEVMKEYKETEERDAFLMRELEDLSKAKIELVKLIADLDARIDHEFKTGIAKINHEFQNFFARMFGGGKAELSLVKEVKRRAKSDTEELKDAISGAEPSYGDNGAMGSTSDENENGPEGLEVSVNLPRKKVKSLMMLSGGERALTSIALLFAISQVNPPPFIILDETDAALDEANSKKYGDMIESLSVRSQLILITHNRETMSRAGVLYGVTMGSDGASRLLSIAFEQAVQVAK